MTSTHAQLLPLLLLLPLLCLNGSPTLSADGTGSCAANTEAGAASCENPDRTSDSVQLPLQFTARVNVTAHHVSPTQTYPPREKTYRIWYDALAGRFRADLAPSRHTLIRRFDKGYEVKVVRVGKSADCWQSSLEERGGVALPEWPRQAEYIGDEVLRGMLCQRWRDSWSGGSSELWVTSDTNDPVQVKVMSQSASGVMEDDVTFAVWEFEAGPPDAARFRLPKEVKGGLKKCERQPNNIGFPYLHFWHHYYRA